MSNILPRGREHREETTPSGLQGTVCLPYSVHVLDTSLCAACSSPSSLRSDVICPKHKWNQLWPQSPLVWSGLEVVLVVSDAETCSVIGMPDCACFIPRSALKWAVERIPEYVIYKISFSALRSFTTKTP